jgi:hypothetical protein
MPEQLKVALRFQCVDNCLWQARKVRVYENSHDSVRDLTDGIQR